MADLPQKVVVTNATECQGDNTSVVRALILLALIVLGNTLVEIRSELKLANELRATELGVNLNEFSSK